MATVLWIEKTVMIMFHSSYKCIFKPLKWKIKYDKVESKRKYITGKVYEIIKFFNLIKD